MQQRIRAHEWPHVRMRDQTHSGHISSQEAGHMGVTFPVDILRIRAAHEQYVGTPYTPYPYVYATRYHTVTMCHMGPKTRMYSLSPQLYAVHIFTVYASLLSLHKCLDKVTDKFVNGQIQETKAASGNTHQQQPQPRRRHAPGLNDSNSRRRTLSMENSVGRFLVARPSLHWAMKP